MNQNAETSPPPSTSPAPAEPPAPQPLKKGTGGFIGNVLSLSAAQVISQGLRVATVPLLSRMFGPAAMGVAGVFESVVTTIAPLTTWNYQVAVVLPKKDDEAVNLLAICGVVAAVIAAATAVLVWLWGPALLTLCKAEKLIPYAWTIPLGVLLVGIDYPLTYWNTRQKQFRRQALARVASVGLSVAALIAMGLAMLRTGTYVVFSRVLMLAVTAVVLGAAFLRDDLRFALHAVRPGPMRQAAWQYREFPLYGSWSVILNSASRSIPLLLLAGYFGEEVAGWFSYSVMVVMLPMSVLTDAIGTVFFQHVSAKRAAGEDLAGPFERACRALITISVMPIVLVVLSGPELFGVILGRQWAEAGRYSGILGPWLLVVFVFSPLSQLYSVLGLLRFLLISNVLLFAARVAALVLGGSLLKDPARTLVVFSLSSTVLLFWQIAHLVRALNARAGGLVRHLGVHLLCAAPSMAMIAVCKWLLRLPPAAVVAVTALSVVPYVALIWRREAELRSILLTAVGRKPSGGGRLVSAGRDPSDVV